MIKKTRILFLFLTLVSTFGCSGSHAIPTTQEATTSNPGQLGDLLNVTYLIGPHILASQNVSVFIENLTEYCIVFPFDYGIKLWVDVNGTWEEIKNMVQYSPEEDVYLEPAGESFSTMGVSIKPDLSNFPILEDTNFKAVLTGWLCDDPETIINKQILFTVIP